jgi:hypothetical protein
MRRRKRCVIACAATEHLAIVRDDERTGAASADINS